jgi:hypothetical protein
MMFMLAIYSFNLDDYSAEYYYLSKPVLLGRGVIVRPVEYS